MKKNLYLIILTYLLFFIVFDIMAQQKKNYISYAAETSYLFPTIYGLSFERQIDTKTSFVINAHGIFEKYLNGFKLSMEGRYYLRSKKDTSNTVCKGWYLGVKPLYFYYHQNEIVAFANSPNPSISSPRTNYSYSLFLITGRQWLFKGGWFLNVGLGVGVYKWFLNIEDSKPMIQQKDRNVIDFINGDLVLKFGYNF